MNAPTATSVQTLQPFVPNPNAVYPIDTASHLTQMPRHLILVCYKHGLISPQVDPEYGGYYFDNGAIRTLQRVEYLRHECGINLAGIRIILDLMNEVERLRAAEFFGED